MEFLLFHPVYGSLLQENEKPPLFLGGHGVLMLWAQFKSQFCSCSDIPYRYDVSVILAACWSVKNFYSNIQLIFAL
jgi:hypothetical protein